VINCGRAGFASYVARDASIDALYTALSDVAAGRLTCPPEISGGLLRALFRREPRAEETTPDPALTRREGEVHELLGLELSNHEIGRVFVLSVATVKLHVHNILDKRNLPRRAQAMRSVRDAPWLARTASMGRKLG
jgi:two-component system, NarL family, nitrate/nitrite response regulator NarL